MVSTKSSKVTYAERVLGAFSHIQREHRKHDIHVASLRAQVKRHAEAKKDTLGPHWTQWVSKAITKLEGEGILEHTVPGSVALTLEGKKAVTDARRFLQIGTPQKDKDIDDVGIWKQITSTASRGVKRPRKSFASTRGGLPSDSEDDTASRAHKSPKKRPRASEVRSSPKKSTSKLTKLELQQELASVKKAYAVAIRRPSSPLTDLSDEDDLTAELKEKLKERDQAIENMKRELALIRNNIPGADDITFNVGQIPSGIATSSRQHAAGVTRTQSGSYIPNLSKQPTPAPSSSERDDDYGRAGDDGVENTDMTIDNNGGVPASLSDTPELSVVAALKSQIQDLHKCMAANVVVISSKETEISDLEKVISDRAQLHESTVSDRDATIASLGGKVSELKTEVNALRESCRVAQETAANLTLHLQATEAFVTELEDDANVSQTKLGDLEKSNATLLHDQERLKLELEQAKTKCIEAENTAEDVRNHAENVSDELRCLRISQDDQISKIEGLVDSLERTSSDAQALRDNTKKLETEIQEKNAIREKLEIQVKQNDSSIAQLSADLQTVEKSVEDMKIRLAEANKKAAEAELQNEKLTAELFSQDDAMQQYRNDLAIVRKEVATWTTKHANDTATLSSTVFNLQQDISKKEADLLDTNNILDRERELKLAAEADLKKYVSKTRELEKGLGYLKTSKEADEATISGLRALFMKLRQSQLQIFGEFEQEIIPAQSSEQSLL